MALVQSRRDLRQTIDWPLLSAGLLFLLAGLSLPFVRQNTIFFAGRWMAPAATLLVLALPAPRLRPLLRYGAPLVLVASLALATLNVWRAYEREELAGEMLEQAGRTPLTAAIQDVLFHPAFPVDIRHNAKIFREQLTTWAAKEMAR